MLNKKTTFQRAHGKIDAKISNNEINRFYQSGSAKVFYPKSSQNFKELVLIEIFIMDDCLPLLSNETGSG